MPFLSLDSTEHHAQQPQVHDKYSSNKECNRQNANGLDHRDSTAESRKAIELAVLYTHASAGHAFIRRSRASPAAAIEDYSPDW